MFVKYCLNFAYFASNLRPMSLVRAKKQLGQHFLTDKNIAEKIVNSLQLSESVKHVLEVGPGMGILSDFLFQQKAFETYLIDIDTESIAFLHKKYPEAGSRIISILGTFVAPIEEHEWAQVLCPFFATHPPTSGEKDSGF